VADAPEDIQLKFDGNTVKRIDGAPAEAVINSLNALQRMIFIIGMRSEGRQLGQRLKPTAKIKREYAVVCRAPQAGSHIQPFNIASQAGAFTPAAVSARQKLLQTLKAFDSGDEAVIEKVLPNARERWFMAEAASGLLPHKDSDLQVTVRAGSHGPFNFKADRARLLIQRYKSGPPPKPEAEETVGKLQSIDYQRTIMTVKPSNSRAVRLDYPLPIEAWLQQNVRRRIRLVGDPNINNAGDITGYSKIDLISEIEPTLPPIEHFKCKNDDVCAFKPLHIPVTYNKEEGFYTFQDDILGIDAFSGSYATLREAVIEDLDMLWRNYAMEVDARLAPDGLALKAALIQRFRVVSNDSKSI